MSESTQKKPFDDIAVSIQLTGGFTLAQISDISGLEPSTIQNWVKRGWVESPKGRRYGVTPTARILIIAMLRGAMQLSSIVELLAYVNGKVDDHSDDAIPDAELYNILHSINTDILRAENLNETIIEQIIEFELRDYIEPFEGGKVKLANTLKIMTLATIATDFKNKTEELLRTINR